MYVSLSIRAIVRFLCYLRFFALFGLCASAVYYNLDTLIVKVYFSMVACVRCCVCMFCVSLLSMREASMAAISNRISK